MKIQKLYGVEGAKKAKGATVIIDVLRAATVSAYLLDKGVKGIIPVGTKEEAFLYRKKNPSVILVGEEEGYKIPGFDFGNSPSEIKKANNLLGLTIVHRSSMGIQGIVNAQNASQIIFGSFVTATAITKYLLQNKFQDISIVPMASSESEDDIFANYLIDKLQEKKLKSMKSIVNYLKKHANTQKFLDPGFTPFPEEDFYLSLELDRFDFVPVVKNGKIIKRV